MPADYPNIHASGRGTIFEDLADEYDALRPSYPAALVESILQRVSLPQDGAVLEVGCGTGKATRLFAPCGRRMVCVEPGVQMAALAAHNLGEFPNVTIENERFEDWPVRRSAFDLMIAAQSFHWVDPEVGYAKVADCLRPGGAAALFWNRPLSTDGELRAALDAVYERHAPGLSRSKVPREMPWVLESLEKTERFGPAEVSRFPWTDRRSAADYARLVATYSDHASLPEEPRTALLDEIRETIERFGGEIAVEHYTLLFFARTRG